MSTKHINWHVLYVHCVQPKLTPADIAWLADVDRTPRTFTSLFARLCAKIGGAR